MSLGVDTAIRQILTNAAPVLEDALGWPISLTDADTSSDLTTGADGELAAFMFFRVMRTQPSAFALRKGGTIVERGIAQISVYVPDAKGPEASRLAGDLVRDLFPRLTTLGRARTEAPSWAAEPLQESPFNHIPVTVPWVARTREGDR